MQALVKLKAWKQYSRQWYSNDQEINLLLQELVQALLVQPTIPGRREAPIGVTGARHYESIIALRFWSRARRCCVGDDIHSHCFGHARHCGTDCQLLHCIAGAYVTRRGNISELLGSISRTSFVYVRLWSCGMPRYACLLRADRRGK